MAVMTMFNKHWKTWPYIAISYGWLYNVHHTADHVLHISICVHIFVSLIHGLMYQVDVPVPVAGPRGDSWQVSALHCAEPWL